MPVTRRVATRILMGGAMASLLAACQQAQQAPKPAAAPAPTAPNPLIKPKPAAGVDLTAVQASSEVAVGRNRFAIGLIDARNQPITSGTVGIEYFKLATNGTAEKRSDAAAVFRSVGGLSKGVWAAPANFNETGQWGAQVTLDQGAGEPKVARFNFEVRPKFSAPGYDEPAVRSASLTARDVNGDVSRICSNTPACSLHSMSVADALAPGQKPLVLLFATPAMCTSATCAPELEAIQQLHGTYGEQANFIHIELYQYPYDAQKLVKAVDEWHLPSDPWAFFIDKTGIVRDRFEGAAPFEEIEPSLKGLL